MNSFPACETILCTLEVDGCSSPSDVKDRLLSGLETFVTDEVHPWFVKNTWRYFGTPRDTSEPVEGIVTLLRVVVARAAGKAETKGGGFEDRGRFFVSVKKDPKKGTWWGAVSLYEKR